MARAVLVYAMGDLGKPCVWAAHYIIGNVDVAPFAVLPSHTARHEGRGGHVLPAGNQSARGPRLAILAAICRRSRLVVLRCRSFQRSQSLVDGDARCDELSHAHELPIASGQAAERYCSISAGRR